MLEGKNFDLYKRRREEEGGEEIEEAEAEEEVSGRRTSLAKLTQVIFAANMNKSRPRSGSLLDCRFTSGPGALKTRLSTRLGPQSAAAVEEHCLAPKLS